MGAPLTMAPTSRPEHAVHAVAPRRFAVLLPSGQGVQAVEAAERE